MSINNHKCAGRLFLDKAGGLTGSAGVYGEDVLPFGQLVYRDGELLHAAPERRTQEHAPVEVADEDVAVGGCFFV